MHSEVFMHAWKGRKEYIQYTIHRYYVHTCPCPFREYVGREIEGVGCKPITRDPIALHRLTKSAILCESSFKATYRHANESCEQSVISSSWAANGATERSETNSDRRRHIRPLINTLSMMQEKRGSQVDWVGGEGGRPSEATASRLASKKEGTSERTNERER